MSWAAVGTAAINIGGGILGGRSAKKAAAAQAQASQAAIEANRGAYDESMEFLDPRLQQERGAMGRVNSLLGLDGEAPDYSTFTDSPGYRFQMDQGQQAIERSAAARGGLQSGNTLAAVTQFGQGLADSTFNNYLAQVMGLQNQGADAFAANLTTNRGIREGDLLTGQGDARASGIVGSNNALQAVIEGAAGALGGANWGGKTTPQPSGYAPPANTLPAYDSGLSQPFQWDWKSQNNWGR